MGRPFAVVFGGAGFIGGHLLRALSARGYDSACVDLLPMREPVDGVRSIIWDVRSPIPPDLVPLPHSSDDVEVYNLAAVHRTPGHEDREYYDTNVGGALSVTDYCRVVRARRLVFTSSISVYGPSEVSKSESSELAPESAYGASKAQAEHIHRLWRGEQRERRLVIVRPAVIFGAGERGNFTRLAHALRSRRFVFPGRKDTIKACGYVHDLVESMRFALGLDRDEFVYNFSYPTQYTISEICEALHAIGGLPRPIGTLPAQVLGVAAAGFEQLENWGISTGINRPRIAKLVRSTNIRPDALASANYQFTFSLETALEHWRKESDGAFT